MVLRHTALVGIRGRRPGAGLWWLQARRLLWLLILLTLPSVNAPAVAQSPAHTLVQITARDISPTQTELVLDFDGPAPEARSGGADSETVPIQLLATGRGNTARYEAANSRVISDVRFDQQGDTLQLMIVAPVRIHADVVVDGTRRFRVRVSARGTIPGAVSNSNGLGGLASPIGLPGALEMRPGEDQFELIPLKYADVSEVVGLLSGGQSVRSNDIFTPREPGFGSPGANSGSPAQLPSQADNSDQPLGQAVDAGLAIDRRLNAILVRGAPAYIARAKAVIEAVDVPLASVVLETEFVELSEQGARSVGFDFANANGQIAVATLQSGQFIGLGNAANGQGRLSSAAFQAALYAQVQKGEGRIVSRPKIAAQSGATAKIVTGDALPILTSITLSGVNGVSQQVQYVNVGVTLQIAPRVSSDGFVSSHVFCVVSSVTGYSQGFPTISQREASTSATVRDGEAFVIGGLVQEDELKSHTKVPVLGDIPVLGRAFRLEKSTRTKTELYIVITPHIIRVQTR